MISQHLTSTETPTLLISVIQVIFGPQNQVVVIFEAFRLSERYVLNEFKYFVNTSFLSNVHLKICLKETVLIILSIIDY